MSELKLQQCRVDGRYDVLDCLGRGSYSEVYVARDVAAAGDQPPMVVIKALNTHLQGEPDADLEQTLIENFRNEAIALDRVRHANIISRLGHGTAIDLMGRVFHYLVLEYLPGGDMQQLCRRRPLKLEGALFYLRQVCAGLEHAHERGVIHRDIKPQNLLLTADQHTVKIADFGVAKLEADGAITRVGTDVYAPPEHHPLISTGQLNTSSLGGGNAQLTPAADIYSLAKTAYMLLTGESPRRFSHKPVSSLPLHLSSEPWSDYVVRALERATQNNPSKRHQSVSEFWDDLQDASLPRTIKLADATTERASLKDEKEIVPPPPPAPDFERTTGSHERAPSQQAAGSHVRIVVPVAGERPRAHAPQNAPAQHPHSKPAKREEAYAPKPFPHTTTAPRRKFSGRLVKWLVALLLVGAFAGMLLATHYYFRREPRQSVTPTAPGAPTGREFVAKTDVNLRSSPGSSSEIKGLVPRDSVVKVLDMRVVGTERVWYQVRVVKYGRPKEKPEYEDEGWVFGEMFAEKR